MKGFFRVKHLGFYKIASIFDEDFYRINHQVEEYRQELIDCADEENDEEEVTK